MTKKRETEVVIVGAGPAGLSAALWCSELGLEVILLERAYDLGGQLHRIHAPIENYLGIRARDGDEMLGHFRSSVDCLDFLRLTECEVRSVDPAAREAHLMNGDVVSYGALIIATGVRRRRLGVSGETELRGKGIIGSGVRDRSDAVDRNVVVVGGGDAAVENALILADVAASVTLVHRRDELTARPEFVSTLREKKNIDLMYDSVVTAIEGDSKVTGVVIENVSSGQVSRLPSDVVLVRIGVEPNSEFVRDVVALDDQGYITVDATCQTNAAGVFAVGDVANPVSPTISTAAGMGATAAKSAYILVKSQESRI